MSPPRAEVVYGMMRILCEQIIQEEVPAVKDVYKFRHIGV